jgi:uncharacterized repeat protein (TIGR01451 family)
MRLRWLVVLAFAGVALLGGGTGSGASTPECSTSGPLICADLVGSPASVPPTDAESAHYVSYVSHISNDGNQSATHVTADVDLSAGMVLVSASASIGTCSVAGQPTCVLGRIASGAKATVEFVAQVPEAEGTATASLVVSFDERTNDGPIADPKQDTVVPKEDTTVSVLSGTSASFVPKGATVELTTDPTGTGVATGTDPLIGGAVITLSPTDVTAFIDEVDAPFTCPKKVVCREGDWLQASIPGNYPNPPLAFPLRWDSTLIPSSLNAKKFALLYTECLDGCQLQVISKRCSSASPATSELPCLTGVAKLADGDWRATLLNSHNGYMK